MIDFPVNAVDKQIYVDGNGVEWICVVSGISNPGEDFRWARNGYQGSQGEIGPRGPQGIPGQDGLPGIGIQFMGTVATKEDLPGWPYSYSGDIGDAYSVIADGDLWVWSADGTWHNAGHIVGADGVEGPTGPEGPVGPKGDAGDALDGSLYTLKAADETITGAWTFDKDLTVNSLTVGGGVNGTTAVGVNAGQTAQGDMATAIGRLAGYNTQGEYAVAMGVLAGQTTQGSSGIAIGNAAGMTSQGIIATAIGNSAGYNNQGNFAVAIGNQAGQTTQGANGIIISSKSQAVDNTTPGHIVIESSTHQIASIPKGGFAMNRDPIIGARSLIKTLSTLREATQDETTLEGLRDSIGNAIGGLIEKFEADIDVLPAPDRREPEAKK